MKYLIAILLLLSRLALAQDFVECSTWGVARETSKATVLFFNSSDGYNGWIPDYWNTVDVSKFVPADTKAICLSTMLIITFGGVSGANLWLQVRHPQANSMGPGNYHTQTIEYTPGAGQRTSDYVCVATYDRKFHAYFHTDISPGTAYGLNMKLISYCR